jgi:single-strand DNA-binding protein
MSSLFHFNQQIVIGNLGKDPEIKRMQNGSAVANFSVATEDSWKDKGSGERKSKTHWHRVVVWNEGLVGLIEKHLHKGDKVMVMGATEHRSWEDKDGATKYTTEVVVKPFFGGVTLLSGKGGGSESSDSSGSSSPGASKPKMQGAGASLPADDSDDIPF